MGTIIPANGQQYYATGAELFYFILNYNISVGILFITSNSLRSCNTHYQANCENKFFHKRCI